MHLRYWKESNMVRTDLLGKKGWNNVSDNGDLGQSLEGLARSLDFVLTAVGAVTGFSANLPLGEIACR